MTGRQMMEARANGTRRGGTRTISPEEIDSDFQRKGIVLGGDDAKKAAYFHGQGSIGPIGIAMALHRRLWIEDRSLTADSFGREVEKAITEVIGGHATLTNLNSSHLRAWVQPSRPVALPEPQYVRTVVSALQRVAQWHGLSEEAVSALAGVWQRPGELLARLRDMNDGTANNHSSGRSPIDKIFLAATASAQQHEGLATLIGDAFVGDAGRNNIVVVVGQRYSGKRRAVIKMIQTRRVPDTNLIDVPGQGRLRLFARNVEDTPIEQIICDVAEFLQIEISADPVVSRIDVLIGQIEKEARRSENAAAYVLAEVPAPGDLLTRLLGKERLQKLIDALFVRGNNRLLLTGTDANWLQRYKPVCQVYTIPPPSLSNVYRTHNLPYDESEVAHDVFVDGPFATLLSTLLDSSWERSPQQLDVARHSALVALGQLAESLRSKTHQPVSKGSAERPELMILANAVCDQLAGDTEVLETLAFLALSEDGIRASSLAELLGANGAASDARQQLDHLSERILTCLRFVSRRIDEAGPWPDEDPPDTDQSSRTEPLLELIPPFRRIFERAFLRRDAADFRRKSWRMAEIVRRQSRWKCIGARGRHWRMPFDMVRDAQALRRAQMALDPDQLRGPSPARQVAGEPRHSALDRLVFSGSDEVDPVRAFRYLYFDVFREDMDLNHRLSLEYERDDLRLNLLVGFCNPGVPTYVGDDLTERVALGDWSLLSNLLPPRDRAELLISIAVSAKRMGAWLIVADAARKATEMVQAGLVTLTDVERVFRCEIDTMVLRCGSVDTAGTLAEVRRRIVTLLEPFSQVEEGWKARVKLQTRLGEALALSAEDLSAAHAAFQRAESIISEHERDGGSWGKKECSPLLGYGARRFLRVLCEMVEREEFAGQRDELLEHASDLYALNLRRMARFPGEISLLLLDQAWVSRLSGRPRHAEVLLGRLVDHPPTAGASLSTRVDVEATHARLALDLLVSDTGRELEDRRGLANQARSSIVSLLRLARAGGLPLHLAFGELCAARWLRLPCKDRDPDEMDRFEGRQEADLERSGRRVLEAVGCYLYLPAETLGGCHASLRPGRIS